ncbi:MAG: site-specific integrase [Oceanicaulis sp.]|nr:site-specific integrase [Oceanicaulis sp.]
MKELTVSEAQQIARAFYAKQTAAYASPPPIADDKIDYEIGYQELLADEYITAREDQIKARSFGSEVTVPAKQQVEAGGFQMPDPGSEAFRALCEGIARAQIENARFVLFRQDALLGGYQPQDELFRGASPLEPSTQLLQSSAAPAGLTLAEAVGRHVDFYSSGPSAWEPKTKEEKERTFSLVLRLWGPELPVRAISTEHVRKLRDFIQALKPRVRVDIDALDDMTASAQGERLNPKTASKYFGYVKTLLNWLDAEGYIDGIPGSSVKLAVPKSAMKRTVRPFTPDELNSIFSSPLYAGFKSRSQRHLPGQKKAQDGIYWMFLLALYAGMREGEVLQLRKADLHLDHSVPHIDIQEELDLKTASSVRKIPIHPDLMAFGLASWVARRPKQAEHRLFYEIQLGSAGHRTSAASKRLNKYLERIAVKAGRELVFHSFRHCFKDAMLNAEVPNDLIKQLLGHKDPSVTGQYGQGANLQTLRKQVEKLDFELSEYTRGLLISNCLK